MTESNLFLDIYRGAFSGILRWPQLDELWETLQQQTEKQWYIYAIGEPPPERPAPPEDLARFIDRVPTLISGLLSAPWCCW